MIHLLILAVHLLATIAKLLRPGGVRAIVAESLLLKHQLVINSRGRRRAPNLNSFDRFVLGLGSLFVPASRIPELAVILKPRTLLRFHEALKKQKYRCLFSSGGHRRPGPKGPSKELIDAIVEFKRRKPRVGCPRIAQEMARTFGIDINKDFVRRVLAKHYRPGAGTDGPSWLSFIGHMKDSLWSVDLFRCESILLKSYWVMVVMDVFTRRIIGFGIEAGFIDGISVCRMFGAAVCGKALPKRVSTDHDPLFRFHRWLANLRVLEIEEIKSVPYAPASHPFVERLIGTVRREYLDRMFFWNALDLTRKLGEFKDYYNLHRVHRALDGTPPARRADGLTAPPAALAHYNWRPYCRGLFQIPLAA
jgi:transposase InsO family protein